VQKPLNHRGKPGGELEHGLLAKQAIKISERNVNMKTQSDVIVIGSGLAGLASACTLAARGYSVAVVEKNEWLGGKAALLEDKGYRFDMGPTILTLPSVLRRVFTEAGRKLEDYLDMVRLDPQWRCFFEDGTQFEEPFA
jgi:phytoene dehydrogenase-like protein